MNYGTQKNICIPAIKTYMFREANDKAQRHGISLSSVIVKLVELWMWDGGVEEKVSEKIIDDN